jgi:hypothetical protein
VAVLSIEEWRRQQQAQQAQQPAKQPGNITTAKQFQTQQAQLQKINPILSFMAGIQRLIPQAIQKPIQQTVGEGANDNPILRALAAVQSVAQTQIPNIPIPTLNVSQNIQNPVARFPVSVGESLVNLPNYLANVPGRAQKSAIQTGQNIAALGTPQEKTPQQMLAEAAPAAELPLNIALFGKGGQALEAGGSLLQRLGANYKAFGPLLGALGGVAGLEQGANAPSVGAQVAGAVPRAAETAAIGPLVGVGAGYLGELASRLRGKTSTAEVATTEAPVAEVATAQAPKVAPAVQAEVKSSPQVMDQAAEKVSEGLDKVYGLNWQDKAAREVPITFQSTKIRSLGEGGQELATRGVRTNAKSIYYTGQMYKAFDEAGLYKLTPEETKNFYLSREGSEQVMNQNVAKMREVLDPIIDNAPAELGIDPIENYAPRLPNEAGKEFYNQNTSLLTDKIMESLGYSRDDALKVIAEGDKKAFFEYQRVLDNLPDEYRDFSAQPILRWGKEYARRKAYTEEFGLDDTVVNQAVGKATQGLPLDQQLSRRKLIDEYVTNIKGKGFQPSEMKGTLDFLRTSMVVSKLTPLTTVANELQSHVAAYLQHGVRGIIDTMGSKDSVKGLGLEALRGKYGDEISSTGFSAKWMKWIGMEPSEQRGILRSAKATETSIDRAFNTLVKDPSNEGARNFIKSFGMYPDDAALNAAIKTGKIDALEKVVGTIEGARQKMFFLTPGERPPYANTPQGSTAYIFHNYFLNQMNLLKNAPLHRQITYMAIIAPLTGLPLAYLRNIITGREQPQNPVEMYQQAVRYGPATPFDILNALGSERNQLSFIAGGYTPILSIASQASQGNIKGTARETFKAAPIPLASLIAPRLFPSKSAQTKEQKAQTELDRIYNSYQGQYQGQ